MKEALCISILFFMAVVVNAQNSQISDTSAKKSIAKNTLSIELLGNGLWGSANYERIVMYKEKIKFSSRLGLFYWGSKNALRSPYLSSIFEQIIFWGKIHHLCFGLGVSYMYGNGSCYECAPPYNTSTIYLATRVIGYRYQKINGGFFCNTGLIALYQVYEFDKFLRSSPDAYVQQKFLFPWFGTGIGYAF